MSDEKKQLSKARQALVDRVLSWLDAGAMPWDNGMTYVTPKNAVTGKAYRGINLVVLFCADKPDPRWMTFAQAKEQGYAVKQGAKGVPIELYKTIDKRTGKDADFTKIREETKDMTFAEKQQFKKDNLQSFARGYHVFNASDIHGIEPYVAPPIDVSKRNERIENIIRSSEAPISYDGNGRNYYSPTSDSIHLTDRSAFKSDEFFYNTALHEMGHSTGHSSRLGRDLGGDKGSKAYAREELVAELSSVMIAAELGLDHSDRVIENSAEYVRSWATLIREDPQVLIDATFDASHATDYICGREHQAEKTSEEKAQKESVQTTDLQPYARYAAVQDKHPDAVVVMRLGDFYEVMGDKAKTVADELELTLTSRYVGKPERVPMCGFPHHVMEQYTEKLLEKHDVAVIENDGEEKLILSHAEARETPLEEIAQKENTTSPVRVTFTFRSDGIDRKIIDAYAHEHGISRAAFRMSGGNGYFMDLDLDSEPIDERTDRTRFLTVYNDGKGAALLCEHTAEARSVPWDIDPVYSNESGINKLTAYCTSQAELEALRKHISDNVPSDALYGVTVENNALPAPALSERDVDEEAARIAAKENEQKDGLRSNMREWYARQFPKESAQAATLIPSATFGELRDALRNGKSVESEFVGLEMNGTVRERVFERLSEILDLPYSSVDDKWRDNVRQATADSGAVFGDVNGKKVLVMEWETHDLPKTKTADREAAPSAQKSPLEEIAQKENGARETQNVRLHMTAAEAVMFNDFLNGWNDGMSERREIMDFGANRPTGEDFWKGLEMLGDVERSDMSFSVKFDRSRAHSFTVLDPEENAKIVDHEAAPTEPPQRHSKPLVVNFYGGPSCGKTTAALELTAALKKAGYNVEYVSEFAKDLVLENKSDLLKDQKYVTDGQYNRLDRIRNSADVIVTDSPVLLGLVYGKYNGISDEYAKKIRSYYDSFDNFNMFVERPKNATFQTEGRVHDESQSVKLDGEIKDMLGEQKVFYGGYKRDDIAKTVERIATTYNRLYGGAKQGKTQKENKAPSPVKPHEFITHTEHIPDAMKALPNWVAFRTYEVFDKKEQKYKLKKTPINPNKGASSSEYLKWAKCNEPETWSTFDKAVAFAKKYKLDGLAFSMSGSGMTCIDLDEKNFDKNGEPLELAQKFIAAADNTYMEKSVSGHGLHIFYSGARPAERQNRNIPLDLEVYDSGRFISMTGNYNGCDEVNAPGDELKNLLASNLPKVQQYAAPSMPLGMDDNALIEKIRGSKRGREFDELMGGADVCGDHSVSDFKLCNMLAFFSGGDAAQVERCFRSSGLYRPEKGDAYVKRTAEKACSTLTKRYTPHEKPNLAKREGNGRISKSGGACR